MYIHKIQMKTIPQIPKLSHLTPTEFIARDRQPINKSVQCNGQQVLSTCPLIHHTESSLRTLSLYTIQTQVYVLYYTLYGVESTHPLIIHYTDSSLRTLSYTIRSRVYTPSHYTLYRVASKYPFTIHCEDSCLYALSLYTIQTRI